MHTVIRISIMKSFAVMSIMLQCLAAIPQIHAQETYENWPAFRGLNASGQSSSETVIEWDIAKSKNIKWKAPILGLAHSCPVIWGNKLYIATATTEKGNTDIKTGLFGDIAPIENETVHEWALYCIDKNSGKTIWIRVAHKGIPKVKRHPKSTHANSTPVTDGKHIIAFYGSEGLFCYNVDGELLWQKDFGVLKSAFYRAPEAQWGFGSSPIIHDGVVIIQVDVLDNSFLGAYDISSGKELWRSPRFDVPTWCTPTIYAYENHVRIAVNGYQHIGGYDFKTGRKIWFMKGGGDIPVPTPILGKDLLFFTSAHGKLRPIYAVRTSAQGDISLKNNNSSSQYVAWSAQKDGAYMPTPIIVGDYFYRLQDTGRFSCYDLQNGDVVYTHKLKAAGWFISSPVASKNAIYCIGEEGDVFVIRPGKDFEIIAHNALNDNCHATPAISDGVIYFRTQHDLIAVSE